MNHGLVYIWEPDSASALGGRLRREIVPLPNLYQQSPPAAHLSGRYVHVKNAGAIREPICGDGRIRIVRLGDALPNDNGAFIFDPARGGARVEREVLPDRSATERYIQASRFGEVNTYYHLDRIATYVDRLLQQLAAPRLPRVVAVVNAHGAVAEKDGIPDGVRRGGRWKPFQGAHYRLPGLRSKVCEMDPVSADGEIHLGPGWQLLECGALAEAAGARYRHNASHNAGILYHEYGHHITRHTADFQGNALRPWNMQDNRKTSLDEGICDYWAATLLDSPHIWAWHRRHDAENVHRRSLTSRKTIADFDSSPNADPHANGTTWAAALWDVRAAIGDPQAMDLLLLKSLCLWKAKNISSEALKFGPDSFSVALGFLLRADDHLYVSKHRSLIVDACARRAIHPRQETRSLRVPRAVVSSAFTRVENFG